jgi:hypothetical protein
MATDPDELILEEAERRADPRRVGDVLERIEWRLQYGGLLGLKVIGWIIVVLLALILWRIW